MKSIYDPFLMGVGGFRGTGLPGEETGGGNTSFRGYYNTPADLPTSGVAGDYAIVGSTDTFWVWDTDTSAFVDTANAPASDYLGMYATIADLPATANPGEYATVKETNSFWYYDTAWIDTGIVGRSVTECSDVSDAGSGAIITDAERSKLNGIADGAEVNVQSNWSETDTNSDSYIQNKPSDVTNLSQHSATELNDITSAGSGAIITDTERSKLNSIADGAEVNVQSDWNETDTNFDSFIQNKPSDLTDLSQHSVTELNDITDAGSGAIITQNERDAIAASDWDITVHDYAELKAACEDGSYKKIKMADGNYLWTDNVDTAITVHSNVTRITGNSTRVVWDVDMDVNNTNLVTALKCDHLCLIEVFTLRNAKHKNGSEYQHRGIIEGDLASFNQNSTALLPIVKRLFLESITGDVTMNDTNYVIAGCTAQDCIANTQYTIGFACLGNRMFNNTIHNPQYAFTSCYDLMGCRVENATNIETKSGFGFVNCNNVVACESIYLDRGFYGGNRISSCYSYACNYGFNGFIGISVCHDANSGVGFESCQEIDEATCTSTSATPYRGCSFIHTRMADEINGVNNDRKAEFDFSNLTRNELRRFGFPDKSGTLALLDDLINPTFNHVTINDNVRFVKADTPSAVGMNLVIGQNGQVEGAPPLTETTEYSDTNNTRIDLTGTAQEILSLTMTEDIEKAHASFAIGMQFDNNDTASRTVTIVVEKNGTQVALTTISLLAETVGYIFVYPGGLLDDIISGDVFTVSAYADVANVVQIRGDIYESSLKIRKVTALAEADIRWVEDAGIIEPKDSNSEVKLPRLSGRTNSIVVTDTDGVTKDSPATIGDAPVGGSMLGIRIYDTEPTAPVNQSNFYVVRKDATTVTLCISDGTDVFKVDATV